MTKLQKLKYCNLTLLGLLVLMLASSIQLEFLSGESQAFVWIHIGVGALFVSLVIYHIELHFGLSGWLKKFRKLKSQATRILWWLTVMLILSAIVALGHWIYSPVHTPAGAIHGKIGLLMLAVAIGHVVKRAAFFRK